MAIILNLFGQSVWEGLKSTPTDGLELAPVQVVNPCANCELREFCNDDCAKHLTPLDVPFNPMTRFRNLRQYIDTLKQNGWA